jgi:hypothetical protein
MISAANKLGEGSYSNPFMIGNVNLYSLPLPADLASAIVYIIIITACNRLQ